MLRGGAGDADARDAVAGPPFVEMCILLSSGAFCTRERRLELHFRVRSARLGARGAPVATAAGPRRVVRTTPGPPVRAIPRQ